MTSLTVDFNSIIDLTDEQFYQLCQKNRDLKFERSATGELIIMAPTGGETGNRNAGLTAQLWIWNQQQKLGQVFDSSTGFKLPNGANRSPDVAWVQQARWDALTPEQKAGFIPLCPDFVIELVSPSDRLTTVQEKMQEYRENGVQLGWLIDRKSQQVEIYRPNHDVEILKSPVSLAGEGILPGFVLSLDSVW
ncbi:MULTISPECIES: Uma2 family endonuclease [Trichocoleus]|uniref:Uma2 family endonuclease n=1 Tax=Trichocoleus desertorum GB2-A4 TaxID=2933944 RepID=A0ABV0J7I6_9CYAN|nr:Uma2 family endonuclease [Trichocoleus sp. FACHB-46]MBD1862082.1 Uma2 family endonuclease [Trichocoleus sp. FACHB-46]